MTKIFLFILFPLFIFAQHLEYESLSDEQLRSVLQKELLQMEARGATPDLIFEKFVVERDVYTQSREAYNRFVVNMGYLADKMLEMKIQNGTDQPSDSEMFKKLKKQRTYQDYLDYKKTESAKEAWENSTQDGILKLVVNNLEQFNESEQKRYDGLIILLNMDPFFSSLTITDGKTNKVIMPDKVQTH